MPVNKGRQSIGDDGSAGRVIERQQREERREGGREEGRGEERRGEEGRERVQRRDGEEQERT